MGRRLKRVFFLLVFLAFLGVALYPKEVLLKCIAWKAMRYCKTAFKAKLAFEDLVWEEGQIVFKKGRLQKANELEATFEQAALLPSLDLKRHLFGGQLTLQALKIVHHKRELKPVLTPPAPLFKFFTLELDTKIVDGELLLYDHLSKTPFCQHAFFDLTHHIVGKKMCGTICFELDPELPMLITHFTECEKELQLSAHFQSQSFPVLSHLITYFFQTFLPEPSFQWEMLNGTIDGDLQMVLVGGHPQKMQGQVNLHAVRAENCPLKLLAEIDRLSCALNVDFSKISAFNGNMDLAGGRLLLKENKTWEGIWNLNNVHSNICIKEGKIDSSKLKANFMGMEGEMVLDWQADDILMKMGFQGSSKEILHLIPENHQRGFEKAFPEDHFAINASLKRSHKGLELAGVLSVTDQHLATYKLPFGCLLGKQEVNVEAVVPENLNFSLSRSMDSFLEQLKQQFCLSQKLFGWFKGENFPLEKFLSPFLLKDVDMDLSGCADFSATFDDRYLVIFYEGRDFSLQSPHFSIHVDAVKEHLFSKMAAVHYFDLKSWNHVGFLPIKNASYWQKNYDFHLQKTAALVHFENNVIYVQNIDTDAEGLELKGEVSITIDALNDIDLKIAANHLKGSAAHAQKFLAHFKPSFFWKIPVAGGVSGGDETLVFHYRFHEKAALLEGRVHGEMNIHASNPLFTLEDCRALIDYDCIHNQLEVKKGKAKLSCQGCEIPFFITVPNMTFSHLPDFLTNFSCKVKTGDDPFASFQVLCQKSEKGKEILITGEGRSPDKAIYIKALHNKECLILEECTCGDWKAASEISFQGKHITVHDFSCHINQQAGFSLSADYDLAEQSLNAKIDEIRWGLSDQKLNLKDVFLVYRPSELNIWSQVLYGDKIFWLHLITDSVTLSQGELKLSGLEKSDALIATWEKDQEKGYTIKKLKGAFYGLDVNLVNSAHTFFPALDLEGRISFKAEKLFSMLHASWKKSMEKLVLAGEYALEGKFSLDHLNFSEARFVGHVFGSDCKIKGISLEAFSSKLEYEKEKITLSDLSINDWAARLFVNSLQFTKEEKKPWEFALERLQLTDLRFSRLKSPWTQFKAREKPFLRSLFIPNFVLENVRGNLNDKLSLIGSGKLEFTNVPKKTFISNLLFLPTEITARIGLDLSNLVPVRGIINYEIKQGKILLKELKEMYSEGKRSRFYLAAGSEAFIDFKGNLNMKLKMKQYNLLMKLAEFFTISVKGSVAHPSYTFGNSIDEKTP